ncbi:Arc family DNA-binding protein [Pseudomonas putida]|uniref:Arc-like DNA binding domain-containing protein n=1 Tax=Pseudomonas putida TaxID=303 RepID=A0A1X0ZXU9_PSEPU|nr:Arc family DNA-binding protein [Pseudomonas putida]ORL64402.1 hypothetical protein B7H17_12455 [Pseudomonas putida]
MHKQHISSRNADKFVIRLPDGMRDRIAEVARDRHRSMNSEIIARLEQSMDADGTPADSVGSVAVYLPESLKAEIERLALGNDRSLHGEVLYRLKRLGTMDQLADEQGRMIGILQRRIEELESKLQVKGAA